MSRISYPEIPQGLMKVMLDIEEYIKTTNLDYSLLELIRFRVSQINGCAYCLDMHFKEAQTAGEQAQRLYSLSCWRETQYYTQEERAVLAWTELVTTLTDHQQLSPSFKQLELFFSKEDIAHLTLVISNINSWNRLMISFGLEAGTYQVNE